MTMLIEQYPPVSNPQSVAVSALEFLHLPRQGTGIRGIRRDFMPNQGGLIGGYAAQGAQRLFAV
ncbi:MAG: hypothetical protein HQL82_03595 [Magnetococcales bacterium]|nr:hypothetical protein [Magnetococcales bacterium]